MTRIESHAEIVTCHACPVRRLSLFRDFTQDELHAVARIRSGMHHFAEGEDIVVAGGENPMLFTLFSGWAFRHRALDDGRRHIACFYLPGDFIDVVAVQHEDNRYGVRSLTASSTCNFRRADLLNGLHEHEHLGRSLSWMAAREAAVTREAMMAAGHLTAVQRVGHLLLEIAVRQRWRNALVNGSCRFPLRQQDIGDHLGLSTEHVNRVLRGLREEGFARVQDRRLTIPDMDKLADAVDWNDDYLTPRPIL